MKCYDDAKYGKYFKGVAKEKFRKHFAYTLRLNFGADCVRAARSRYGKGKCTVFGNFLVSNRTQRAKSAYRL